MHLEIYIFFGFKHLEIMTTTYYNGIRFTFHFTTMIHWEFFLGKNLRHSFHGNIVSRKMLHCFFVFFHWYTAGPEVYSKKKKWWQKIKQSKYLSYSFLYFILFYLSKFLLVFHYSRVTITLIYLLTFFDINYESQCID